MILKEEVTFIVPPEVEIDHSCLYGYFVNRVGNQLTLVYSRAHKTVRPFSDSHAIIIEDQSELEDQIRKGYE